MADRKSRPRTDSRTDSRSARAAEAREAEPPARALTVRKRVDPASVHEVNRDELNRVLDTVSKSGLASLTVDERRFLMNFVPPDDRPPMVS